MNTFKKKSLYAALAGASALGVTGAAHAVNVNPDGLGQVLIYPYYTINDKVAGVSAFSSLLSVVNTTNSAKVVKVRFLEGKASQEVLDFNLFLSPSDVWTAAVLPAKVGAGAGVATFDTSCTLPKVSADAKDPTPFVNFAYAGDGAGDGLERTKEGYVEIIEMGVPTQATVVTAITHVNGKPPGCDKLDVTTSYTVSNPTGGLFGGMTLINVLAGEDFTEDAVAIADFRTQGKYDLPGDIKPDLRDVTTAAVTIDNTAGLAVVTSPLAGFTQSIDAVSAVLMHDHVYNEFVLDSNTLSGTDWVVTFPTKRYYYNTDGDVLYLFQRNFGPTGACDDILFPLFDREEFRVVPGFSPPPKSGTASLCWEANVVVFPGKVGVNGVLGSLNTLKIVTSFQNGWGDLQFVPKLGEGLIDNRAHQLFAVNSFKTSAAGVVTRGTATYVGLPVIGFAAQSFLNGTLSDGAGKLIQSSYGGNFVHKTKRTITGLD